MFENRFTNLHLSIKNKNINKNVKNVCFYHFNVQLCHPTSSFRKQRHGNQVYRDELDRLAPSTVFHGIQLS